MRQEKIPCSVGVLTHNSTASLQRALVSVAEFAEIIVCDGGSTDATLEIAAANGARVISQNPTYLDANGRIADFAAVRNQTLVAATEPWFFFLDSDEYLSDELVAAIRTIAMTKREGAYWVSRKYVVNGVVVECATTYPNYSMRLFARASVERFIKPVHERIKLKEGVVPAHLDAPLYVPVDTDLRNGRKKDSYYIAIAVEHSKSATTGALLRGTFKTIGISGLYLLRLIRIYLFCRGQKMPLGDELSRHVYNFRLVTSQWRARL